VGFFWKKGAKTLFLEKRAQKLAALFTLFRKKGPRAQKTQKALYKKGFFRLFFYISYII
jgi:hypothetical protein